jgi:hypothetical protein
MHENVVKKFPQGALSLRGERHQLYVARRFSGPRLLTFSTAAFIVRAFSLTGSSLSKRVFLLSIATILL